MTADGAPPLPPWTAATIRQAREARGWSQKKLAAALNAYIKTSLHTVRSWEQDRFMPGSARQTVLSMVFATQDQFDAAKFLASLDDQSLQELIARIPSEALLARLDNTVQTAA